MSQAGSIGNSGGTSSVMLTPDSGGNLVGNAFPIKGYPVGVSQVMKTFKVGSDLQISDQTYLTRYVVDQNVTPGYAGTYSTIQSAIDQAVADGAISTVGPMAIIWLRPGDYQEDVVIPPGALIWLKGSTPSGSDFNNYYDAFFGGTLRFNDPSGIPGSGIYFFSDNVYYYSSFPNNCIQFDSFVENAFFQNCTISNGQMIINQAPNTLVFKDCSVGAQIIDISPILTSIYCYNSEIGRMELSGSTGWNIFDGQIADVQTDDTSFIKVYSNNEQSFFNGLYGDTTSDCVFTNMIGIGAAASNASPLFDTNGKVFISNFSYSADPTTSDPMNPIQGANCDVHFLPTTCGNMIKSRSVTTSYLMVFDDYYVGVSDTSALRTISLPSNPVCDALYIVKDESMLAGTNNITIDVNAATGTIDGAASTAITTNGGCIHLKSDSLGVNYFII